MSGKKKEDFQISRFLSKVQNKNFKKGNSDFAWTALPVTNLPNPAALSDIKSILNSVKAAFNYV